MICRPDENSKSFGMILVWQMKNTPNRFVLFSNYSLLQDFWAPEQVLSLNQTDASAVVFVDLDYFKNCDLIDLPSCGTKDEKMTILYLKRIKNIDILVYMSLLMGFKAWR